MNPHANIVVRRVPLRQITQCPTHELALEFILHAPVPITLVVMVTGPPLDENLFQRNLNRLNLNMPPCVNSPFSAPLRLSTNVAIVSFGCDNAQGALEDHVSGVSANNFARTF